MQFLNERILVKRNIIYILYHTFLYFVNKPNHNKALKGIHAGVLQVARLCLENKIDHICFGSLVMFFNVKANDVHN